MNYKLIAFLIVTFCPFWILNGQSVSSDIKGEILAVIGTDTLTSELFEESYVNNMSQVGFNDTPEERRRHLEYLIDTFLFKQGAEELHLDKTDTSRLYMQRKMDRSLVDLYIKRKVHDTLSAVSENDVKIAFKHSNEERYVRQLYFVNREEAESYNKRLRNGESFLDLANELYGMSGSNSGAGYIGAVSYFDLDDKYAEVLYKLDIGEYSGIIQARTGYYIIRLENLKYNPVLTENEYVRRHDKVRFLLKQRKHRLAGDQFIRDEMQQLNVTPDPDAIRKIYLLAASANSNHEQQGEMPKRLFSEPEINSFRSAFDESTPLARYERKDGEVVTFTAGDFYYWIPMIPAQEILQRTIPAVGRAIYYKEFSARAKELNLTADPLFKFNKYYVSTFHLAEEMKEYLASKPISDPDPQIIDQMMERVPEQASDQSTATYETIPFSNSNAAEKAVNKLNNGADATDFSDHQLVENSLLKKNYELGSYLRKLTRDKWYVVGTTKQFYAVKLLDIEEIIMPQDKIRSKVIEDLKPKYREFMFLQDKRESVSIHFNSITMERHINSPEL